MTCIIHILTRALSWCLEILIELLGFILFPYQKIYLDFFKQKYLLGRNVDVVFLRNTVIFVKFHRYSIGNQNQP